MSSTYSVHGIQMEPKLGRLAANLERILDGSQRRPPRCAAGGLSRVRALGLRLRRREEGLAHAVSIDGPEVEGGRSAARHGCFCVFGMLERDGSRLFNACVLTGPGGSSHLPQGPSAVSGDRHVRRPRRPAVRGSRRRRAQGRNAHLLRRIFPETARVLTLLGPISWCCRRTGRPTPSARPST